MPKQGTELLVNWFNIVFNYYIAIYNPDSLDFHLVTWVLTLDYWLQEHYQEA